VYEKEGGERHINAVEIQQARTSGFKATGEGKWMPFDGGSHNGGVWLHEVPGEQY